MSLLKMLSQAEVWEKFYEYKTSLICSRQTAKRLRSFIDEKRYLPVCERIEAGEEFPLGRKKIISKQSSQKKRTVYTYPKDENTVLKLLTYLILRKYDGIYADNLYSFRPQRTAKDAIRTLLKTPGITEMYSYKADVSDYFNSIPLERFLPVLADVMRDDPALLSFLSGLLQEERVLFGDEIIREKKGIMAGTPLAAFYANLYLKDLDAWFSERCIPYARYSDDIIVFADTKEKAEEYAAFIREYLADKGLAMNPDKEVFSDPSDGFVFLGFLCRDDVVDIAPVSVTKLKKKMRRKTRALQRRCDRNDLGGEEAAETFIRIFNRKLLENSLDQDLTWKYWFFSMINTTASLHVIDEYAQECIRWLISGTHTKARYDVRYEDLKKLGYESLVHAYYSFEKEQEKPEK